MTRQQILFDEPIPDRVKRKDIFRISLNKLGADDLNTGIDVGPRAAEPAFDQLEISGGLPSDRALSRHHEEKRLSLIHI